MEGRNICNRCGRAFNHKHSLRRHERLRQTPCKPAIAECTSCGKTFTTADTLKKHYKLYCKGASAVPLDTPITTESVNSTVTTNNAEPMASTDSIRQLLTTDSVKPPVTTDSVSPISSVESVRQLLKTSSVMSPIATDSVRSLLAVNHVRKRRESRPTRRFRRMSLPLPVPIPMKIKIEDDSEDEVVEPSRSVNSSSGSYGNTAHAVVHTVNGISGNATDAEVQTDNPYLTEVLKKVVSGKMKTYYRAIQNFEFKDRNLLTKLEKLHEENEKLNVQVSSLKTQLDGMKQTQDKKAKDKSCQKSAEVDRQKGDSQHFPELIPATKYKSNSQKTCIVCRINGSRKYVRLQCNKCEKHPGLCAAPCFQLWHTTE